MNDNQTMMDNDAPHGLTSQQAREAGLGDKPLKEGQDYVVEHGREIEQDASADPNQEAVMKISDDVNDDDVSQRMGDDE